MFIYAYTSDNTISADKQLYYNIYTTGGIENKKRYANKIILITIIIQKYIEVYLQKTPNKKKVFKKNLYQNISP